MGYACRPTPYLFGPAFGTNPLITIFLYISMAEAFRRAESIVSSLILVGDWGALRTTRFPAYEAQPLPSTNFGANETKRRLHVSAAVRIFFSRQTFIGQLVNFHLLDFTAPATSPITMYSSYTQVGSGCVLHDAGSLGVRTVG